MTVTLLAVTPSAEKLIEHAGRVCWRTSLSPTEKGHARFIKALIKRGHLSVIEHASATFEIDGISRSCSHQIVRHRLASYSQESMRYVSMDSQEVVTPPLIAADSRAQHLFDQCVAGAQDTYQRLRALGVAQQDARFVLPIGTHTRIVMTQNFRSWRHFIELRCERHAQWEIRTVASTILAILYREAPAVFEDLQIKFRSDASGGGGVY